MANLLTGTVGDHRDFEVTVRNLPSGRTLTKAWLTIKINESDADVDAVINKEITTSAVPGTGQIQDDGASDGVGVLLFEMSPADTILVGTRQLPYAVQVELDSAKVTEIEHGVTAFRTGRVVETT